MIDQKKAVELHERLSSVLKAWAEPQGSVAFSVDDECLQIYPFEYYRNAFTFHPWTKSMSYRCLASCILDRWLAHFINEKRPVTCRLELDLWIEADRLNTTLTFFKDTLE